MQEVYENVIEKLDKEKLSYFLTIANTGNEHLDSVYEKVGEAIDKAIEIVKQAAEQYQSSEWGLVSKSEVLKVIEDIKCNDDIPKNYGTLLDIMRKIRNMSTVDNNGWIPVKTRPMTKEECEYREDCVYGESFMYECKLPDDNQEVLICTKYGTIRQTTFYTDMGCYFENYEDDGEVTAWMPLPEPYQPKGE